ncbi:hypothetical protein TWF694_007102 [Orbilia ellipsospora]|uniref:Uncharacterized protein n=1 Tax=Orbilia ellipsospora TaxID=2528407 RepID=A0AAV9XN33_9PEZI
MTPIRRRIQRMKARSALGYENVPWHWLGIGPVLSRRERNRDSAHNYLALTHELASLKSLSDLISSLVGNKMRLEQKDRQKDIPCQSFVFRWRRKQAYLSYARQLRGGLS